MSAFRCVAIETSGSQGSVAACNGERVEQLVLADSRASSRKLYGMLRQVLSNTGLRIAELDCVAFGCGPGSFTGLRVAASAAQALAYSRALPVSRVSSLAALAVAACRQCGSGLIASCSDARMGEAYFGLYEIDSQGLISQQLPDQLVHPGSFRFGAAPGSVCAAGGGWSAFPELLANHGALVRDRQFGIFPDARAVLQVAKQDFLTGRMVEAREALPNYLRDKVTD